MAVLLVVLFHSGISTLSGGYIGVDVFFVISGFVITGVLLRERSTTGRTSILAFYGRRCRRIIPAATLVIIVTVVLSYFFLGIGAGGRTATDGRWATVFLANFHFSCHRDQLPGCPAAPLSPPELLVPVGRGAVLRRLPDAVPAAGGASARVCRSGCAWPSAS